MDADPREVFRQQCCEVRSILTLAERRKAAFEASRSAAKMPSGNPFTTNDVTRATTPSDLHAWIMTVQLAGRRVGRNASFIMYARLCRRQRSAESSWERIALEADMAVADVKQVFRLAVPAFLAVFEAKGMTTRYRTPSEIDIPRIDAQQPPDHCFANEIGQPCPMAAA
jgi:hypothetical protein